VPEPFIYDGNADYDHFEKWCYEVDKWILLTGIPERYALQYISTFLSGKAATYFMTHVATSTAD